jgi:ribosomal protein L7Ae-like RNA K-turn-binding protein
LRTVLDGLSLAQAAGDLVSGHDALEAAILQGKIAEIVVAADAAERTVRDLVRDQEGIELTHLPIDRVALGAQIGADPRAAVGLVRSPAFRHLRSQLRRLRSLG